PLDPKNSNSAEYGERIRDITENAVPLERGVIYRGEMEAEAMALLRSKAVSPCGDSEWETLGVGRAALISSANKTSTAKPNQAISANNMPGESSLRARKSSENRKFTRLENLRSREPGGLLMECKPSGRPVRSAKSATSL